MQTCQILSLCRYLSVSVMLLSFGLSAAEDTKAGLDAHEHDHGQMNIVVDESMVFIEFMLPGVNVVGFEHAAETAEQKKTVQDSLLMLERADALFQPNREANCEVADSAVEQHIDHGHMAFEAKYQFKCASEQSLERLDVYLFARLRDLKDIDVQLVTPDFQTQVELTADDKSISLVK